MRLLLAAILFLTMTLNGLAVGGKFGAYYTRLAFSDKHTGKFADVVVRLDGLGGQIIFPRQSSYLPLWKNNNGAWYFDQLVPRKGDGDGIRPDALNKYSYVRVIENKSQRVIVHFRYMPDFDNVAPEGVVHEHFTILPSGKITRTIRKGTKRFDDFIDPKNVTIQTIQLEANGIKQLSLIEAKPQHADGEPVIGNPAKKVCAKRPIAWWKFDEGL
ncbi:MAG TPA: hypothetical protein HPP87_12430 [Planctomycetes bacterium]|nr:hypothetical protein [Planctomycetota bacterium]